MAIAEFITLQCPCGKMDPSPGSLTLPKGRSMQGAVIVRTPLTHLLLSSETFREPALPQAIFLLAVCYTGVQATEFFSNPSSAFGFLLVISRCHLICAILFLCNRQIAFPACQRTERINWFCETFNIMISAIQLLHYARKENIYYILNETLVYSK